MICWRDKTFCSNSDYCRVNKIECKQGRLFTDYDMEHCDMSVCYGDIPSCIEFSKAQVRQIQTGLKKK